MSIRSISRLMDPIFLVGPNLEKKLTTALSLKYEKTEPEFDRDGNGRMEQEPQSPVTEEEFALVMEYLISHSVVAELGLVLEPFMTGKTRFILVKEKSGKIVRKISERELRKILVSKGHEKGSFLSRSA